MLHRFSQERLAEASSYSVDFISLVERGLNTPSVEGCERIAKALRLPLKDLFDFSAKVEYDKKRPRKRTKKATKKTVRKTVRKKVKKAAKKPARKQAKKAAKKTKVAPKNVARPRKRAASK
jgi:transcriptional regulator with XRE-family HTH domain